MLEIKSINQSIIVAVIAFLTISPNIPQATASEESFKVLQKVASQRLYVPAILEDAIITELPSSSSFGAKILISKDIIVDNKIIELQGARLLCDYSSVRNINYVPVTCHTMYLKTHKFKIQATAYAVDGNIGLPASHITKNGSVSVAHATKLKLLFSSILPLTYQ